MPGITVQDGQVVETQTTDLLAWVAPVKQEIADLQQQAQQRTEQYTNDMTNLNTRLTALFAKLDTVASLLPTP